jgi:MazG family protein
MQSDLSGAGAAEAFARLLELIKTLRSENGCPWDRKQTVRSFHPFILEEYHELVHALNEDSPGEIADEMGDLLFLVIFVAYMLEQQGLASLAEIMDRAVEKMTRRHPHVFGDAIARNPQEVIDTWTRVKSAEETIRKRESLLDGIPRSLPALSRAQKLARRAGRVGFDWTKAEEVFLKIDEELAELREAAASDSREAIREEIGDLLFVVTNAARHLDVNSETALTETSDKFERRFRFIESRLRSLGKTMEESSLGEMDELWEEAKAQEKNRPDSSLRKALETEPGK